MTRTLLAAAAALALAVGAAAQTSDAGRIRASFLTLIDRPRVPLAAETRPRPDSSRYKAERFSFTSEAGERVPGIFIKHVTAADKRPAVILLHGTGAKKEDLLAQMRTLADRGFAAAAIDARHHGERIKPGQDPTTSSTTRQCLRRIAPGRGVLIYTIRSGTCCVSSITSKRARMWMRRVSG